MSRERVCIVSSGSLSSGPRVEKEAVALAEAGYDVNVLVCHSLSWREEWDRELAAERGITLRGIALHGNAPLVRVQRRAAAAVSRAALLLTSLAGPLPALSELASSDRVATLFAHGLRQRADLYIAHNLPALAVAAALARVYRARLAFDCEDDHLGELSAGAPAYQSALVDSLQSRYLPDCAYVSAPSDGIADLLAERYRITRPIVVHNVFPWSQRDQLDGRRVDRRSAAVSLYWYSQTLGLDRGVQDALRAAGRLRGDFELHLRGHASRDTREALLAIAREGGIAERVFFHEQVQPGELLSRTAEHDIGLALEQPVSRNRLLTVTNKIFFYLVAGLAVAATETPGQTPIMSQLADSGFSYPPGDHEQLARGLQRWLDDRPALQRTRAAALEAARTRFCWEIERDKLLAAVRLSLS
ncbi:MAG TPA: glycosyltransferase [Polyangiales bacterium]|nr:glycosyltransferase [Polyangiales bacterium]